MNKDTLSQIMEFNEESAHQLTLDLKLNVDSYLNSIIKKNELEIMHIVQDFMKDYSYLETRRLRSFGVKESYQLAIDYNASNLVTLDIENYKIPIGYRQGLKYITQTVADKALKQNNHFYCKVEDSTLFVEITASYLAEIQLEVKDLLT